MNQVNHGRLYGIGVSTGDPELLTLKAVRILREVSMLALPHQDRSKCVAYRIAVQAVPELEQKDALCLHFPMTKDQEVLQEAWINAADEIRNYLEQGMDVGFPVIGDPGIYSTFSYVADLLQKEGFPVIYINGIPSFCGAAAALDMPLVQGEELLYLLPNGAQVERSAAGTLVHMKGKEAYASLKARLEKDDAQAYLVERAGFPEEKIYRGAQTFPEQVDYLSLIIEKRGHTQEKLPAYILALRIAMQAHEGQFDKAGKPYILHPLHVASKMETEETYITALLHDVVEDTDVTLEDLAEAGFSDEILQAVALLTHDKDVPYMDYIRAMKDNSIARAVKLADLAHNSDPSRLKGVTPKDLERLDKYKQAIALLTKARGEE